MRKTIWTFWIGMLVLLIAGLAAAPRVDALSAGVACSIEPLAGTDCDTDPLKTDQNYDVLLTIQNNSRATCPSPPCPLIGATLTGVIYEWDSCTTSDCADKLTGVVDFVSATSLNPAVIAVQPFSGVWTDPVVDPPDLEIIVNNLVMDANKIDIPLAIVTKKPLGPNSALGVCGQFYARFETPTNAVTACENTNCVTGGGQCSTQLFYPPNPKLELEKVCDKETPQPLGKEVSYTVTVKNTGDVPLTNVQLIDANLSLNCTKPQPFTLLQDEVVTCTGNDVCMQTGPLENTVSATADWDLGTIGPVDANAACACVANPKLEVTKNCTPPTQLVGNDINYSVTVQNTGDIKLTVNSVDDPTIPGLMCNVTLPYELAPGDFFTCSGTDTCEQLGVLRNEVTVNAQWLNGEIVEPISASAFTEDCQCEGIAKLEIEKACEPPNQKVGEDITFTVNVKNTGSLGLTNVQVSDPTVALSCSKTPPFSLAAGEVVTCTGTDTCEALGPLCNTVTATADSLLGPREAITENCECICVGNPQIQVKKTCDPTEQLIENDINYSVEIKNVGDLQLTVTEITDPTIPGLICSKTAPFDLAVNEVVTCTGTDTCETLGALRNEVTVKAESLLGPLPPATAYTVDCVCKGEPKLEAEKTCTPPEQKLGQNITYVISVKNTGDVTLTNVQVNDPQIPSLTCTKPQPFILAKNEIVTCEGTLQCPLTNGPLYNEATITAESVIGPPPPVTVSTDDCECSCPAPALIVDKNCESPTDCKAPINYTLHIENPGLTRLNCTVSESGPAVEWTPALPETIELAPGAKYDYTGMYTTDPGTTDIKNTVRLECVDECQQPIVKEDEAVCSVPPCFVEICRTPGFWATHAGTAKQGSTNITQCVINAAGGLFICGNVIDNTSVDCADSAVEAMCVAVKGDSRRQLARQLTAAALNCVMTNGNADCTGVPSVATIFADCNALCASPTADKAAITECIGMIDAFNNGLLSDCHERPLCNPDQGLCFDPPGPANPDACQAAKKSDCGVVGSDRAACTADCLPTPNPNCPDCAHSFCSEEPGLSKFPIISRILNIIFGR